MRRGDQENHISFLGSVATPPQQRVQFKLFNQFNEWLLDTVQNMHVLAYEVPPTRLVD